MNQYEDPYQYQLNMLALLRYQMHPLSPMHVPTAEDYLNKKMDDDAQEDRASDLDNWET